MKLFNTALFLSLFLSASVVLAQTTKQAKPPVAQTARVTVDNNGFNPSRIALKAGVPARLTFTRTSKGTCATSVVIPDYKIKKELPLGKPVVVTFTPKKAGTFSFACGMNMVKGSVVVR